MTEHIVIGAGLAGAATAYALTLRGEDVTVLEQHTPANAHGSSHGSARILRFAYPQRLYLDLVVAARAMWDDVERAAGTELITTTGALDHGEARHTAQLAAPSPPPASTTRSSAPHRPAPGGPSSPSTPRSSGTRPPGSSTRRPR